MKIIKKPNFKPQTCSLCGCVFKFKAKDISFFFRSESMGFANSEKLVNKKVVYCPVCDTPNEVDFKSGVSHYLINYRPPKRHRMKHFK